MIELRSTLCSRVLRQRCAGTSCAPRGRRCVGVDLRSVAERACYRDENYWKLNYRYVMVGASGKKNYI